MDYYSLQCSQSYQYLVYLHKHVHKKTNVKQIQRQIHTAERFYQSIETDTQENKF